MGKNAYEKTANIADAQSASVATPASPNSPLTILLAVLKNMGDLQHVSQYTTDDFIYVSLNYKNSELKRIMPWAGTTAGTEGLVQTFNDVSAYWTTVSFELQDTFENADGAAAFGCFTYRSNVMGKTVTSPLSILARVKNGKISFMQFMEDTFATARSFRESGTYRIAANPDGSKIDI
ncbi:nuclear transport factor 2 family protein [Burkholderia cepacia]|uniref:nuclear transport factor 2 family protein n=1 Tax=Burkholderia cepacia TaxID=292 RepID=UPI002AB7935B|nr:nuclear transport factor 2 family protein [Burkholderia cepacia]